MTGQLAVEPPVWGQGQKTPMQRLKRLWVLLTSEEVFHEDGTTARDEGAQGDPQLARRPGASTLTAAAGLAGSHRTRHEGGHAVSDNPMFLYAGDYQSVDDAKADLEALKELHREHVVGTFDDAVITKNESGKVKIVDTIEKTTQHGGWAGLAVGAALGVIFPPSILVSALVGAGAGALIGHLRGGMSRKDLKEIGEMLDESEAALIVVGEATVERAIEEQTKRVKKEVRAQAKEIEEAIDQA